jgi:Putative auto-transporter adhesin, head GIN domain
MIHVSVWRACGLATVSVLVLSSISGCAFRGGSFSAIEGSGVSKTETRKVDSFSEIDVGNALRLQVQIGDKTTLEITGDDNLVPLVKTKVNGDKLEIGFDGSYSSKMGISVKVTTPKLTALSGSGASSLTASDLQGSKFKLSLSGASNATLTGKVDALEVECSGASRLIAKDLPVKTAKVEASGASHVEVAASEQLEAKASGASSIGYVGKPKEVSPQASGASSVKELSP